ncbi:MAG: hypothetical protein MO853_00565 [Candidatus Protistobacter heckmanni]|nr:hypothetical protein [Candidatus Protistobacter heckmanni]
MVGTYRRELHAIGVPLTPRDHPDPIAFNPSLSVYVGAPPDLDAVAAQLLALRDRPIEGMGG